MLLSITRPRCHSTTTSVGDCAIDSTTAIHSDCSCNLATNHDLSALPSTTVVSGPAMSLLPNGIPKGEPSVPRNQEQSLVSMYVDAFPVISGR